MARVGLQVGEVLTRSGLTRKALRLYEAAGIIVPASRTPAGYRIFDGDVLALLAFVTRARRLGFRLTEIPRSSPSGGPARHPAFMCAR